MIKNGEETMYLFHERKEYKTGKSNMSKATTIPANISEIIRIFKIILAYQKELLYSSIYAARTRLYPENNNMTDEKLVVEKPIIVPSLALRTRRRRYTILFDILVSPLSRIRLFYSRGYIVYSISSHVEEKNRLPTIYPLFYKMYYTFPPKTIESYLVFYTNKDLQNILADYIRSRRDMLPEALKRNLSLYSEIVYNIPKNIEFNYNSSLPHLLKVSITIVNPQNNISALLFEWKPSWIEHNITYEVYLMKNKKTMIYSTPSIDSLLYLVSLTGNMNDLENYTKILDTVRDTITRALLVLRVYNRFK